LPDRSTGGSGADLDLGKSGVVRVDPAFRELFEHEFQTVFRACYLVTGDRAAAEDATQEAFARCLERWGRLRDQPWVAGWVTTTALNLARRSLRRRPAPPEPERIEPQPDLGLDLWRGIRALPPRQQEALLLHYAADLPLSEVAQVMGCGEGTVKTHLSRARAALRRYLEGEPVER
jgi:RNA polymerase sigma-70 factor (ECF subfamily)